MPIVAQWICAIVSLLAASGGLYWFITQIVLRAFSSDLKLAFKNELIAFGATLDKTYVRTETWNEAQKAAQDHREDINRRVALLEKPHAA